MTNVESMDYTHSHPSIIASLFGTVHCPFSPWELVQTSLVHPNPVIWYTVTHKPPYIFLKTATIPTYYGISIAIPRYIAMQPSTVPFIMTRFIISILLFAWSCSWHCICGKATVHNSFIHVTPDSLHIPIHRRRHSHRVIFCSKYWVVIVEL